MTKTKKSPHEIESHDEWLKQRKELLKKEKYFLSASSFGSDFNFDFNVSFTEEQQREGHDKYEN